MDIALQVKNLVKSYGNKKVVKGISFTVYKGEIFALLGANGAGKTTSLECIEGIRKYDSGEIEVNGKIGVQLQSSSLPANITAFEAINLFSRWNNAQFDEELFNTFGLDSIKNKQYREMSTGQKRRLHLALALVNHPDIVFLDEPTAGLDVEGRVSLHGEIRNLKQQGKTIIMASHDMAEVESLCDRIAILREGEIAFTGTSQELTANTEVQCRIRIKTEKPFIMENLKNCKYAGIQQEYTVYTAYHLGDALLELLQAVKESGNYAEDVDIEHATLEQRFIDIAKGENK